MSVYSRLEVKIDPEGVTKLGLNLNDLYKQIVGSKVKVTTYLNPIPSWRDRKPLTETFLINKITICKEGIELRQRYYRNVDKIPFLGFISYAELGNMQYPLIELILYESLDKFLKKEPIIVHHKACDDRVTLL